MVKKHEKMPSITSSQENANVKTFHFYSSEWQSFNAWLVSPRECREKILLSFTTMWANVSIKFITTDITSLINKENPWTRYQKNKKLYTIKFIFIKQKEMNTCNAICEIYLY